MKKIILKIIKLFNKNNHKKIKQIPEFNALKTCFFSEKKYFNHKT